MDTQVFQLIVNAGGLGVALWMLNNVWVELKVQNQRIYDLLQKQDEAHNDRAAMQQQLTELKQQIANKPMTGSANTPTLPVIK